MASRFYATCLLAAIVFFAGHTISQTPANDEKLSMTHKTNHLPHKIEKFHNGNHKNLHRMKNIKQKVIKGNLICIMVIIEKADHDRERVSKSDSKPEIHLPEAKAQAVNFVAMSQEAPGEVVEAPDEVVEAAAAKTPRTGEHKTDDMTVGPPVFKQTMQEGKDYSGVPKIPAKPVGSGTCPGSECAPGDCEKCWETCGNCPKPDDIYGCTKEKTWALTFDDGPRLILFTDNFQ